MSTPTNKKRSKKKKGSKTPLSSGPKGSPIAQEMEAWTAQLRVLNEGPRHVLRAIGPPTIYHSSTGTPIKGNSSTKDVLLSPSGRRAEKIKEATDTWVAFVHEATMAAYGLTVGEYVVVMPFVEEENECDRPCIVLSVWPGDVPLFHLRMGSDFLQLVFPSPMKKAVPQSPNMQHMAMENLVALVPAIRPIPVAVTVELEPSDAPLHLLTGQLYGRIVAPGLVTMLSVYGKKRTFCIRRVISSVEGVMADHRWPVARIDSSTRMQWLGSNESSDPKRASQTRPQEGESLRPAHYEDVGGLAQEIQAVRELVEAPLRDPAVFDRLGITPPRGVLLYGPPGTGKTLLARAVATECGAAVLTLSGGSFQGSMTQAGQVVGALETQLRTVFDAAARQAPAMVVLDEVDAIAPSRDEVPSEHERRAVATLLSLLDGATPLKGVVVLATTNRPNAIDAALRRPGRLDREIEIGVPSAAARHDILRRVLRGVDHRLTEEALEGIAHRCHGFVGADLKALVHESHLCAIKRVYGVEEAMVAQPKQGRPDAVSLHPVDLEQALTRVRPSAMREVLLDIPKVSWEQIGGQAHVKQKLKEAVEWPLLYGDAFARMHVRPPRGILLYGPPGCSKTMMAKALATESGLNFVAIKGPELFSKWVGESERAVQKVFQRARAVSPSIVFLDEVDALGSRRGSAGGGGGSVQDRVLSQLLLEMDGVQGLHNVVVVGATNRPDMLDPALMRPGRFDRILYVGLPDAAARAEIFSMHLRSLTLDWPSFSLSSASLPDVVAWLVQQTQQYSGAECAAVCREAVLQALHAESPAAATPLVVTARHFTAAVEQVPARTSSLVLSFYEQFQKAHRGAEM